MTLSPDLIEVYASGRSDIFYVEALSIAHPDLPAPVNITNWPEGFTGGTEDGDAAFVPLPFSVQLPSKDTEGSQTLSIQISNADLSLIDEIELMSQRPFAPAVCRYRIYLNTDFTVQQLDPSLRLELSRFTATRQLIQAEASMVNMHNRLFPKLLYNPSLYRGLDR